MEGITYAKGLGHWAGMGAGNSSPLFLSDSNRLATVGDNLLRLGFQFIFPHLGRLSREDPFPLELTASSLTINGGKTRWSEHGLEQRDSICWSKGIPEFLRKFSTKWRDKTLRSFSQGVVNGCKHESDRGIGQG